MLNMELPIENNMTVHNITDSERRRFNEKFPPSSFWDVGNYFSDSSICINLIFNGKHYHYHDDGFSLLPRFVRIGLAIERLEKESGLLDYRDKLKAESLSEYCVPK